MNKKQNISRNLSEKWSRSTDLSKILIKSRDLNDVVADLDRSWQEPNRSELIIVRMNRFRQTWGEMLQIWIDLGENELRPRDGSYFLEVPRMAPMMRHQNPGNGSWVLDQDRGSEMCVVSLFLAATGNKTVRTALGTMPRDQAPTIKSDRCMREYDRSWSERAI